eukprot:jgi/Psemu1/9430/gm1.9430_g
MEEGYKNNISSENNINSEDDNSDDDDIPPLPLSNTANTANTANIANGTNGTNPTATMSNFPTNSTNATRTQCTNHHKCTSNRHALMVRFLFFTVCFLSLSSPQFASPPSPWSAKRQYRNTKVNHQEILDFLRENSKLKREQRIEKSWLEREHREAVLEAERQQRGAALESLKAAIIDVPTLFGRLHPLHLTRDGVYDRDGSDFDGWILTWIK